MTSSSGRSLGMTAFTVAGTPLVVIEAHYRGVKSLEESFEFWSNKAINVELIQLTFTKEDRS
jgi:hypothetical protein